MAVPAVTCAAKIAIAWATGDPFFIYNAALSATATNSPTSWEWTILSVPVGLEAVLTGTWGDFTDGVATTGAGGTSAVGLNSIPTNTVAGTIVVQAVAMNGDGPSVPTTDKKNGQQCIVIKTEKLDLPLPGDREYGWGQGQLDEVLRKLEAAAGGGILNWTTITEITSADSPYQSSVGELVLVVGPWVDNVTVILPAASEEDHLKLVGVKVIAAGAVNTVDVLPYPGDGTGDSLDDAGGGGLGVAHVHGWNTGSGAAEAGCCIFQCYGIGTSAPRYITLANYYRVMVE